MENPAKGGVVVESTDVVAKSERSTGVITKKNNGMA